MKSIRFLLLGFLLSVGMLQPAMAAQTMRLPHNLSESHSVHMALLRFAELVKEGTKGEIEIEIVPNGVLGSEPEVLEQLMVGIVPMTKVSAAGLASYNDAYHTFGLPYIFRDKEHYYKCMDSQPVQDLYMSTGDNGFFGLTFYTSGSRSFYTAKKAIRTPADLKGLKIRTQDMRSQTDMVKELGGTPVSIPYGDVYTSLQTGIVDGAENNETALTTGKHGEVAKFFSMDEHAMLPDLLVISAQTWNSLTDAQKAVFKSAAKASTEYHKELWDKSVDQAVADAEKMGVTIVRDVDKPAFQKAVGPLNDRYKKEYPAVKNLLESFEKM